MKVKRGYLDYLYLGFFVFVVISFLTGMLVSTVGYSMVVIDNADPNSMWPTYYQGDLFVLQNSNPEDIALGDVIVYENSRNDKIIHRVIDIIYNNGQYYFRVKGDNPLSNSTPDEDISTLISENVVLGKVISRIPYLGHISLAMQRNDAVRIFVYLIAVLLGIAIVFWPEDEEDEEKKEEFIDINKTSIKVFLVSIITFPKDVFLQAKNSRHRIFYLFGSIILVILLILPAFIPSFIAISSTKDGIGVGDIKSTLTREYSESLNGQSVDFTFIQVEITLYDNEGYWARIKDFTLTAYTIQNDPSSLISTTKWKILRDFKGFITIGASLVIDKAEVLVSDSIIYLVVNLHWIEFFTDKSQEYYADIIYQSS